MDTPLSRRPTHRGAFLLLSDVLHGIKWADHPISSNLRSFIKQLSPKPVKPAVEADDTVSVPVPVPVELIVKSGPNPSPWLATDATSTLDPEGLSMSLSSHPLWSPAHEGLVLYLGIRREGSCRLYVTAEQLDIMFAAAFNLATPTPYDSGGVTDGCMVIDAEMAAKPMPELEEHVRYYYVGGAHEKDLVSPPEAVICETVSDLVSVIKSTKSRRAVPADGLVPSAPAPRATAPAQTTPAVVLTDADRLAACQCQLLLARACNGLPSATWLSIDIEATRDDAKLITEIGIAMSVPLSGSPGDWHITIPDNFPTDPRVPFATPHDYKFGTSLPLTQDQAFDAVRSIVSQARGRGPLLILCHDYRMERDHLLVKHALLPDECPAFSAAGESPHAVMWFDTQLLYAGLTGTRVPRHNGVGLIDVLRHFHIPFDKSSLHNAGNHAKAALLCLEALLKAGPPHVPSP